MLRRVFLASLFSLALCLPATAQEVFDWLETRIYFGMTTKDGTQLTALQWQAFLDDEVTPRFPDGLTVLEAYGQSSTPLSDGAGGLTTKVLIIVHPATPEDAAKFEAIKAVFEARFGPARIFHTESPVRVVE